MIKSKLPSLKDKLGLVESAKIETKTEELKVKKTKVGDNKKSKAK